MTRGRQGRQPGLDPFAGERDSWQLHGLLTSTRRRWDAAAEHVASCPPDWIAWSGGKDSTALVHLTVAAHPTTPVVHLEAGLCLPEVHDHLHQLADAWQLDYHEISVGDGLAVQVAGGRWDHTAADGPTADGFAWTVIDGPSLKAAERFGPRLSGGLRAAESAKRRRMLAAGRGHVRWSDGRHGCSPLWRWSDLDVYAYHAHHDIPLAGVYATYARMGVPRRHWRTDLATTTEAIGIGKMAWLRHGWPDLWTRLTDQLPRLREFT